MNQYVGWNKLEYDLLISDCINSYFENNNTPLEVTAISHTAIRGSNDWINKKILTVLSHIPKQVLISIKDAFNYFGDDIDYDQIEALFYRDRLCQAVGRVIGNRGGKTTDLIIHKDILNVITNNEFPYTFNIDWKFTFDGFEFILNKIQVAEDKRKENKKQYVANKIYNYNFLDELFEIDKDSTLLVSDVKEYLDKHHITGVNGTGILPVTKLAQYFGASIVNKRLNGRNSKCTRCIVGVAMLRSNYK